MASQRTGGGKADWCVYDTAKRQRLEEAEKARDEWKHAAESTLQVVNSLTAKLDAELQRRRSAPGQEKA